MERLLRRIRREVGKRAQKSCASQGEKSIVDFHGNIIHNGNAVCNGTPFIPRTILRSLCAMRMLFLHVVSVSSNRYLQTRRKLEWVQRAIYVRNQQIDGFCALRIYWRICVLGADARPRKRGASDPLLTPLETPRRRRGLKVAVVPSALTGTALTMRPSPVGAASSRPSVCVRCPRHENRLRGTRKGAFPIFVKSTRCARAKRRVGEVSREAEPAWAFS